MAGKTRVSNEVFVKAFLAEDSPAAVAIVTGMAATSVAARATRLRKAGVNLPKFTRKNEHLDVEGLNALITECISAEGE